MGFLLSTRFGLLLYLVLPHHWTRRWLTAEERDQLDRASAVPETSGRTYAYDWDDPRPPSDQAPPP